MIISRSPGWPARLDDIRRLVAEELQPTDRTCEVPAMPDHVASILARLRQAIQFLNHPSEYNSTEGRKRKHFLYQVLADGELGEHDPMNLIAKELGINLRTLNACAEEHKLEGLGFFPIADEVRSSLAQEWIPVRLIHCASSYSRPVLCVRYFLCVRYSACPLLCVSVIISVRYSVSVTLSARYGIGPQ